MTEEKIPMPSRRTFRLTGITEEWEAWMQGRSLALQQATQKRGMPMTYGHGKVPEGKKNANR